MVRQRRGVDSGLPGLLPSQEFCSNTPSKHRGDRANNDNRGLCRIYGSVQHELRVFVGIVSPPPPSLLPRDGVGGRGSSCCTSGPRRVSRAQMKQ